MLSPFTTKRPSRHRRGAMPLALTLALAPALGACTNPQSAADSTAPETPVAEAGTATEADTESAAPIPTDIPSDVPADAYVTAEEARAFVNDGAHTMDIRNRYDFADGHIMAARNVASGKALEISASHYDTADAFLIVADNENVGENAWMTLAGMGVPADNIKIIDGGMEAWFAAGYPYETSEVEGC